MNCPKCGKDNAENSKFCRSCGNSLISEVPEGDTKYLYHKRYKVIKPLRIGGMSTIYLAEDLNFDGLVCVIKEMSDVFKDPEEREYAIQKFKEEAFILAKLRHPNIPVVSNHFIEEGKYNIVMDYIDGINLEDLLMDSVVKGLAEEDVIEWAIQICEILEYLHAQTPPIIHRDIKPSNFIKREDGKIIIIDFGIARIFEPKKMGTLIGTPGYISPEQYAGQIDIRSDIFALGATIHQLLTGKDPGQGVPFDFPPVCSMRPDVSKGIEEIVNKSLQQEMDKRYRSTTEMKQALMRLKEPVMEVKPAPTPVVADTPGISGLIPETTPARISGESDKRAALKIQPEKQGIIPQPQPLPIPVKKAPVIAEVPPDIPIPDKEETYESPSEIAESPVSYLRAIQLQSFHGKDAIKKVLSAFVGIDIGSERIKILYLDIDENYFVYPAGIAVAEIPPNTVQDGVITDPKTVGLFIKQILAGQKIKARRAVVSIPQKSVKGSSFFLPEMAHPKMVASIVEEAKNHFPFSLDRAQLNYEILEFFFPDQIGKLKILVWAVPEDVLMPVYKTMQYAELQLTDTMIESFAIKNALELILRDTHKQNNVAVVSMGASSSSIHIIRNSQVWHSKTFFPGGTELTNAIADRINVNKKQAENLKITKANMDISKASHIDYVLFKTIEPLVSKVVDELISSLDEYESTYEVNIPIAVLLCGGTALLKNVDRYIEKSLSLRSYLFQLPVSKKVSINSGLIEELGSSFMVPLGLAISPFLKGIDPAELTKEPLPETAFEEEQEEEEDTRKEKKGFWSWFK